MNIEGYLTQKQGVINQALDKFLPSGSKIAEAMRYSVIAPGKRFRGVLVLATVEALGKEPAIALPTACAIEFIHTFSLIHDDLPAIDNDDFRRGKPSCHKAFGEALAILSGDALNTLAFQVIAEHTDKGVNPQIILEIIKEISGAMGVSGVVGGEVLDLEYEGKKIDLNTLRSIHSQKTGALIRASVRCGATLGEASSAELESLTTYAEHLGLAFQIVDDILDVTSSLKVLGKSPGSDVKKKKATYPALIGLEESKRKAQEEGQAALLAIKDFDAQADPLRGIINYVIEREK